MVLVVVLTSLVRVAPAQAGTPFVVMQMNLCNSGLARSCYSFGRAVDEAAARIREQSPDLVTLQEICSGDVSVRDGLGRLARAMAGPDGRTHVSVNFVPAFDRDTDDWYRCTGGGRFGIAVLHRDHGRGSYSGWYASQDGTEEVRAWTCTTVLGSRLTGCTTHLSTDPDVAVRQCHELMSVLASSWVMPEVIVAGDFNLTSTPGQLRNVQECTPAGYDRRGDGAVQHVLFSRTVQPIRSRSEDMRWTDHPLLYETFRV
jgi:endonuclease/exonuclease/phosphatase family metal-dependent hydrolase